MTLDWTLWGEWKIPWFHTCYIFGIALELKKRCGFGLSKVSAEYDHGTQRVYVLESEWKRGGEYYLNETLKNPRKLANDLKIIKKAADVQFRINKNLLKLKPEKLSQQELEKWYKKFHNAQHMLWSSGVVTNLLEFNQAYFSSYLRKHVEDIKGKISEEYWQVLITPTQLSTAQKEKIELLKIVSNIEKNKKLSITILKYENDLRKVQKNLYESTTIWNKFKKHFETYRWLQYGWIGPAPTIDKYIQRLITLLKEGNTKNKLSKILKNNRNLIEKQQRYEKSLRLDAKHKQLLALLRKLLFYKAYRVDAHIQGYYAFDPILRSLAKKFSVTFEQIRMIHGNVMFELLKKKKITPAQLSEACKYSALIKEGNKMNFYVGKTAVKKIDPIKTVFKKIPEMSEFKGQTAYPGKIKGKIKLILSAKEMQKMQKGDILVSHVTDPSLLPAMEKAAAFVTDMGGLTAHAAIVAREMKKPCIVGTKIATKVLKDGDLVEVDANKGIVKILKRK